MSPVNAASVCCRTQRSRSDATLKIASCQTAPDAAWLMCAQATRYTALPQSFLPLAVPLGLAQGVLRARGILVCFF